MPRSLYVLSYDISNDKRRRKLVAIMEGVARRVQYSVFEACLSPGALRKIIDKSAPFVKKEEGDSLRIYRVCESCRKHCVQIGGAVIDWESDIFFE